MTPQESIQPINSSHESGRAEMASFPQRAQNDHAALAAKEVAGAKDKAAAREKQAAQETAKTATHAGSPWNIRMRFEVEPETQQVTVYIINRQSHEVIRTIPADELEKMQQGELLELFI